MFSTLYFAATSSLSSESSHRTIFEHVMHGRISEAVAVSATVCDERSGAATASAADWQLYADLQLVLGRHDEAEDSFRKVHKSVRQSRDAIRIASCRNAAWQAFFQNRFSTALACFNRVAIEPGVTSVQRLTARIGTVLALHHLGCLDVAAHLSKLHELASEETDSRWRLVVNALHRDILTQQHIRSSSQLDDHIYWRSAVADFLPRHTDGGDDSMVTKIRSEMPLLGERLVHLDRLRSYADGKVIAVEDIEEHIHWSLRAGLDEYHRTLCLDITLAALAGNSLLIAENMLGRCRDAGSPGQQHERWYLDYLYCLAKVRRAQGRIHEAVQHYGRYALVSMKHVRADCVALSSVGATPLVQPAANATRSDDVSACLPGKYRRAYRYLMENLDQRGLSVREIAAHVGVTERALQIAFKAHLGLSPRELIQRQRMERIRDELLDEEAPPASVLGVANKWGVRHRSTLLSGYRKLFNEAPSETLAR